MQLDLNQIRDLLVSLDQTDISEFTLKGENFEMVVRRGASPDVSLAAVPPMAAAAPLVSAPVPAAVPAAAIVAPPVAPPSAPEPVAPPGNSNWLEIKSPMVGTFYTAPAPGESAFVAVGDRIKIGQTVCILEAMKLMNELESEVEGQVVEILVENGQPVEFDQPLMRVAP